MNRSSAAFRFSQPPVTVRRNMGIDVSLLLPWGNPKIVSTKRGERVVREAVPTDSFWQIYRTSREELYKLGVTVKKNEVADEWVAKWWSMPVAMQPQHVPKREPYAKPNALRFSTEQFTLRDYQQDAVDAGLKFLTDDTEDNGILIEPTGSGKSLVIASIVRQLPGPSIVFQPSKEILEQNLAKFQSYGYHPAVYSASLGRKEIGDITLATIGSVVRHKEDFAHMQFAIIDECHALSAKNEDSMFMQVLGALNARVLGLTATPYRLSTDGYGGSILKFLTRTRPRVFSKVVHYVQNGDLFRQGHLCKLEYREIKGFDKRKLKLNSTGADYTDQSVLIHFKEINYDDMLFNTVESLLREGRKSILVFTRFVDEARYLASRVLGGEIVTAETPKNERERLLAAFRDGTVPLIANVGVLTIGFDFPALSTVVLARPTMSLALYYQMVGRGVRTHSEKDKAVIVDLVGLVKQFGRVEDLVIHENGGKWIIKSGDRQLTNCYFGEPHQKPGQPPRSKAAQSGENILAFQAA